jgi:tetratricopeptide (TPR) repeat protein
MIGTVAAQDRCEEGLALLRMRDHLPQAEAAFRAGLALDPDHVGCLTNLAVTLRNLGRLKEAGTHLARALELAPEDPVVHMQTGTLLRWRGRMEAALTAYDAALALDPGHVNTRVARTMTLQQMHRWHEALADYDRLMAVLPPEVVASNVLPRRRAEVKAILDRIASYGVDSTLPHQAFSIALYHRANQLVLEDRLDEAVRLYEDAALLKPDYGDPAFPLGETVAAQEACRPAEPYLSCRWLEESLHFHHDRLAFCCSTHTRGKNWPAVGPYHGGPVPVDYVLARRTQIIRENQVGTDNACLGCPALERRAWRPPPHLFRILILNTHTVCNQTCNFCFLAQADFDLPSYYYLAEPALDFLWSRGWLAPDPYVLWGGGEPTLSKEFLPLATRMHRAGARLNIYSNVTFAVPVLEEALRNGRCDLITSLDSGTSETFYRIKYLRDAPVAIKGRPAFETVWSNIATYAQAGPDHLIVKYILTQDNAGEADLAGFIEGCRTHGVRQIMVLTEVCEGLNGTVSAAVWDAFRTLLARARATGLAVLFNPLTLRVANLPADLKADLERPGPAGPFPLDEYLGLLGIAVASPDAPSTHALMEPSQEDPA